MAIATAEETGPAACDDPGLARAIAEGDPGALAALYDRYAPALHRFALARLRDRQAAEDAVQETLLAAWQGVHAYRGRSRLGTWLFGICLNKVRDQTRRRAVAVVPERLGSKAPDAPERGGVGAAVEFWESFVSLSPEHQEALLLAFHYGFSQEEMAEIMAVPVGTVKSRVHYARRAMRRTMEEGPDRGPRS